MLEGFHALKHAVRFGAEILEVVAVQPDELAELASRLAPELRNHPPAIDRAIPSELLASLAPKAPRTGVMAIARRSVVDLPKALTQIPRPRSCCWKTRET